MSEMTATRIGRAATLAVGVVVWCGAAWLLWRTSVPSLHLSGFDQGDDRVARRAGGPLSALVADRVAGDRRDRGALRVRVGLARRSVFPSPPERAAAVRRRPDRGRRARERHPGRRPERLVVDE